MRLGAIVQRHFYSAATTDILPARLQKETYVALLALIGEMLPASGWIEYSYRANVYWRRNGMDRSLGVICLSLVGPEGLYSSILRWLLARWTPRVPILVS